MKYFGMPADFKKETIDKYERLNSEYQDSRVSETYGQITVASSYEAGRLIGDIPRVDINMLKDYIKYSESKGIGFNYTINGPCMGNKEFTSEGIYEIKKFLSTIYDAGVRSLTVALPSLMQIVRSTKHDFEIKASTLSQITNTNRALTLKKAGADRIVLEESINREFHTIKRITEAFGDKVEVIVNTLCYKDCVYRPFHYNQMGHDSINNGEKRITSYYNHLCMLKRCEDVGNVLKLNWIRPEDIKYYTAAGVNYFKVQGRHTVSKGDPARVAECYFKESYDGNLLELFELFNAPNSFTLYIDNKMLDGYIKPYYETENFCKRDCLKCKYCDSFVRKCTDYEKAKEMNEMANNFYTEYDEFMDTVRTIEYEGEKDMQPPVKKVFRDEELSFDFDSYENVSGEES